MKSYNCLMGILLSAVFFVGSAFASDTSTQKLSLDELSQIRSIGTPANENGNRDCTDCEFDFTAYGSECCDSAWDEFGIDCATLEANYSWDCSGCTCPGDVPCEDQGLITCEFGAIEGGNCAEDESGCLEEGDCPAGQVADCDGSGECWPESWIGDGFPDCEDQQYGADLTCYDDDGGDCVPVESCEDQGLFTCPDGSCAASEADCPEPGECDAGYVPDCVDTDCCPESWIGDGFEDCEDQAYGCDLTCYDNDGGDCDGSTTDGGTTGGSADCESCEFDFTAYGSECCDTAWDEFGISCADLEANYYWDCSGCNCPGDGDPVCGDGSCNGDETYETCPEDCNAPGECDTGYVSDCVDDDCCPESWIGDGFEDCADQAYGCDLTCYDNDGGDCPEPCDGYECWDGSCVDSEGDCPDQPEIETPEDVCVSGSELYGYPAVTVTWHIETVCGDGLCNGDEDYYNCPDDCNAPGECDDGFVSDCVDDDCCPESWIGDGFEDCEDQAYGCDLTCYDNDGGDCGGDTTTTGGTTGGECDAGYVDDCSGDGDCCPESWIGDGFEDCEDQAYGCDLTCYDNDGGDCGGDTTTGGTTGGTESCDDCEFDFTAYGSECCDTAWDEFGISCADLEANYYWDCSGCTCPGDGDPVCGDGSCNGDETYESCPEDCNAPGECDAGYIIDCVDDDCCPESWIGDGFEDCEDQAYGCDLTCYDNDGGDCDGSTTTGGTTGGSADCESCEFDFTAYGSECCDTAWDEFGIDCATLEANYSWDCSGCACPGDGPAVCGDGNCTGDETYDDCPEDCLPPGECPDGQVLDCDGTNECWPESWIGDGFEDCEDQQYGADLTCYDNDGGDCGEQTSCEDQGLIECLDGTCAASVDDCPDCPAGTTADCSGDGDCGNDGWIGDGYCDGVAQQYGINNCCYDNDGGDCTDEECTEGARAEEANAVRKYGKGQMLGISESSPRESRIVNADKQPIVNLASAREEMIPFKDGVVLSENGQAVRMGQVISSSRELLATISFECLEGTNAGFAQSWDADPSFGEFTVYGWDLSDFVCATITFCDGGACSDSVGPGCVYAGSDDTDCPDGGGGCEDAGTGDVNGDGSSDVLDIVQIVNVILGGSFSDDCAAEAADVNGDGSADVLDIVQIVNMILGRSDMGDATTGKLIKNDNALLLEANGYVGGVQMTLEHGADFMIELTDDAMLSEYKTVGNQTTLVIVVPEGEELFTFDGDFEIVDMIIANSTDRINVGAPTAFSLSEAYPNPFNPTTSMTLAVPVAGQVSVQVYNLMGQVVATLASGHMDASTYTLTWDASNVSSGVYFVQAEAAGNVTTQKLMLMK